MLRVLPNELIRAQPETARTSTCTGTACKQAVVTVPRRQHNQNLAAALVRGPEAPSASVLRRRTATQPPLPRPTGKARSCPASNRRRGTETSRTHTGCRMRTGRSVSAIAHRLPPGLLALWSRQGNRRRHRKLPRGAGEARAPALAYFEFLRT
jgi:hypothetical protein